MLQDLIKDLQSSLKSYSQGLANKNLLVDIPWTMVDGDLNLQRLIFRKDNSLYIVKEGEIQESKWEYLPAMNSLVIEVGGKKILMNEVFADGKALILKKDGVSMDFLSFANQNELPDLNLIGYLKSVNENKVEYSPPRSIGNQNFEGDPEETQNQWIIAMIVFLVAALVSMMIYL
jgi:hypothetical protein